MVKTVTHALTEDANQVNIGVMAWVDLIDKYGHLRPDTYNITSDAINPTLISS